MVAKANWSDGRRVNLEQASASQERFGPRSRQVLPRRGPRRIIVQTPLTREFVPYEGVTYVV